MKDTVQFVIITALIITICVGVTTAIVFALYTSQKSGREDCTCQSFSKVVLSSA